MFVMEFFRKGSESFEGATGETKSSSGTKPLMMLDACLDGIRNGITLHCLTAIGYTFRVKTSSRRVHTQ